MQSDHHPPQTPDTPHPSSPPIAAFHRPQPTPGPTPTIDDHPSLRRRHTPALRPASPAPRPAGSNKLRICLATPFADSSAGGDGRKQVLVDPEMEVREMKDRIGRGELLEGRWVREGMRVVWRGRIVRDEERVGEVVGQAGSDQVQTFHLVARKVPDQPRPTLSTAPPSFTHPSPGPSTLPFTASSASPLSHTAPSVTAQALLDTTHYLLFTARHQLCELLALPPLKWADTIPHPLVDQDTARLAIMSVVRSFAVQRQDREEGWEGWERCFDDDLAITWEGMKGRQGVEAEVRRLWAERVGRNWKDGEEGEVVPVELDETTYHLHLPPLALLAPRQLTQLLVYLRITALLPLLAPLLTHHLHPTPTPTMSAPAAAAMAQPGRRRLTIPEIPASVLHRAFWSFLRVNIMMWMLTRGMTWDDYRFWIIGGGVAGWWLGDTMSAWRDELRRTPSAAQPAPGAAHPPDIAQGPRAHPPRRATRRAPHEWVMRLVPLVHLSTDSAYLQLAPSATHRSLDDGEHAPRRAPRNEPSRLQTWVILPVMLWVVTLVPAWEAMRTRSIRNRERAIRVVVGELTQQAQPQDSNEGEERVYPEGLGRTARKYYERVMDRGEGIDWEEEREAQRALGMQEEDEQADRGFGLF